MKLSKVHEESSCPVHADLKRIAPYTHPSVYKHLLYISSQYNYMFCVTPKVGLTTLKQTFRRLEMGNPSLSDGQADVNQSRMSFPLLFPTQIPDFAKFLHRDDIKRFCFVRNPYTRTLSAYIQRIERNKVQRVTDHMKQQLGRLADEDYIPNFEAFIDAIEAQPISIMNEHWMPQYYQVCPDQIPYHFIGRFESFETDLMDIGSQIHPDFSKYYQVDSPHRTGANSKIAKYYTDDLAKRVYTLFKKDFETFGYSEDISRCDEVVDASKLPTAY